MRLAKIAARQSSRPQGALGRLWGPLLDRSTQTANRHALEALALRGDDDVLEIGFGGGRLLSHILESANGRIAGLELSETMIRRAQRRFRDEIESERLRVVRGDAAARIPFADGSFDWVVSVHTIYFWPDVHAGLREIARVLRPTGTLVLATATQEFLSRRRMSQHGYRLFTDQELRDGLTSAGFEEARVERKHTIVISRGTRPSPLLPPGFETSPG